MENTEANQAEQFTIEYGTQTENISGRNRAVREAKRISQRHRGRVRVKREDSRVQMQYLRGELIAYTYDTTPHRGR